MQQESLHEGIDNPYPTQSPLDLSANVNQPWVMRLQRTLSPLETWGFGLTAHLSWPGVAPAIHAALGSGAILVWLPGVIVGMLLNLQVKRLGEHFPDIAGGTPNYTTRLLKHYPGLGRYAAIGYFFSWVSTLAINVVVLTDLIQINLGSLGISCPDIFLEVGFTLITFIVAFSGTRALSILHLFFIIPSVGLLLAFCLQGTGWLAFSPSSPGFFPTNWSSLSFVDWAKWFFFSTYAVYACESASAFVADSQRPAETLRFLNIAAWLQPPIFLGGSWILMRLATNSAAGGDSFLTLLAASKPFWGQSAGLIVTFLIAAGCLLSCATVVSNCPRMLYQLALDGHLSPVFAIVSRRGVLGPALFVTLFLSLICLAWGDVPQILIVGNTGWFVSIMSVHLGLWVRRRQAEVRWPWWSLGFFAVEAVVLVVGGLSWGWKEFLIGFLFPLGLLVIDAVCRHIRLAPLHPAWWINRYRIRRQSQITDFVALQVVVLILLICSAVTIGWFSGIRLVASTEVGFNLLVVLLLSVAFVGVAIACWTSLPQVFSMGEAREAAEHLFLIALDAILVLDEGGVIRQANPATSQLFGVSTAELIGSQLNTLLPGLTNQPEQWPSRSEQTLNQQESNTRILEVAISDRLSFQEATAKDADGRSTRTHRDLQEYVVILRDITERKQAEEALQQANEELELKVEGRTAELRQTVEQLQMEIVERQRAEENLKAMQNQIIVQEKLASLGSLTAGIAHEIRNPLNFVNNFAELSAELTQEVFEEIENQTDRLDPETSEYIADLLNDLKQNLQKINQHGQRADSIVGNMLLHSRGERGQWQATDINNLLAEYVKLAYHGMRAKDASFNITIEADYDEEIGEIPVVPQDLGRVFLNLVNNACYTTHQKRQKIGEGFLPLLSVTTKNLGERVEIRIRDNGKGMNSEVLENIFNPFFTTKPSGQGTGLGLSISHDVIVQQHRGELKVETEADSYAEFIIVLPRKQV